MRLRVMILVTRSHAVTLTVTDRRGTRERQPCAETDDAIIQPSTLISRQWAPWHRSLLGTTIFDIADLRR